MLRLLPPFRRLVPLLAVSALLACAGGPGERPVAAFDMQDLPAPAMFQQLAQGLGRPVVLELPPGPVNLRFDVHLKRTNEREILEEICQRDPSFQFRILPGTSLLYPTGEAEAKSPFSARLATVTLAGSAAEVARKLMEQFGLTAAVLQVDSVAGRRPVALALTNATLRDALAEMAAQAHLTLVVEPTKVRVGPAAEASDR